MSKKSDKQIRLDRINELEANNTALKGEVDNLNLEASQNKNEHDNALQSLKTNHETEKQTLIGGHEKQLLEQKSLLEESNNDHKAKIELLNNEIKNKDDTIANQQKNLNKFELKKMAEEYAKQEISYIKDVKKWTTALVIIAVCLLVSTSLSIHFANGKPWYDRFEFYLIDFIFISAVWFSASQYSYYVHLVSDYANRKTVAQSYHNILLSLNDENYPEEKDLTREIKNKFIEKASEVLCAPSLLIDKEPVLSKKLVKEVAEIVKAVGTK